MGETQGQGDTGYTPTPVNAPDVDYEPLEMDVDSVKALGEVLIAEADNFGNAAGDIKTQLKNQAPEGDTFGQYGAYPVGADPDDETLHDLAMRHDERMQDMGTLLDSVTTGVRNLGSIAAMLMQSYGSQDALNAAKQSDVAALIDEAYAAGEKAEGTDA